MHLKQNDGHYLSISLPIILKVAEKPKRARIFDNIYLWTLNSSVLAGCTIKVDIRVDALLY